MEHCFKTAWVLIWLAGSSICLPVNLAVHMTVCLFAYISMHLSLCLHILSVSLSVCLYIAISVSMSVNRSTIPFNSESSECVRVCLQSQHPTTNYKLCEGSPVCLTCVPVYTSISPADTLLTASHTDTHTNTHRGNRGFLQRNVQHRAMRLHCDI